MCNVKTQHCKNEIQGKTEDVIFPQRTEKPYKVPSRDCSILHGNNSQQKNDIENAAKKLGVTISGRRCPFYANQTSQQDCPYFK